jgi:hypothetical protein
MEFSSYLSLDFWINFGERYKNYVIGLGIVCGAIIAGSVYWYSSYARKQELAQATLSDVFHDAARAQQNIELWPEVEMAARTGYKQFSQTSAGPFFLALQAEAFHQLGKKDEAMSMMADVLKQLSKRSPLYYIYAIKEARMMLDQDQEAKQQEGLKKLEKIAQEKDNKQADEAFYYVGHYYASRAHNNEAHAAFEKVFEITKNQSADYPSPWVKLAQEEIRDLA